MQDLDANGDLTRLPGAGPGGSLDLTDAHRVILRYVDVLLVVVAAPVVLALGAPSLGYAIAAGAWVAQRIIAEVDMRWISNAKESRTRLGLNLFEAFGRIWLLAGAIVLAAVAGARADGLAAALTIFCAYSVAFAVRLVKGRPPVRPER